MGDFWLDLTSHPAITFGVTAAELARRVQGQVYLATPSLAAGEGSYDPADARTFTEEAGQMLWALAGHRVSAVSPVVLSQAMIDHVAGRYGDYGAGSLAMDAAFWEGHCAPLLNASTAIYVPSIEGWRDCASIRRDVADFVGRPRPVYVAGWP